MSIEDNPFLRMQKAYRGSCDHPMQEGKWTPDQVRKIEASGFFESRPKTVHIFGQVYFMTKPEYKALLTLLGLCLLCISVMVTCSLISVIQP